MASGDQRELEAYKPQRLEPASHVLCCHAQMSHPCHGVLNGSAFLTSFASTATIQGPNGKKEKEKKGKEKDLPKVPRPPIGIVPNLLNGTENVITFGVTSRITMTFAGSAGISFEDILLLLSSFAPSLDDEVENGFTETYPLKIPIPIAAAGNNRNAVPKGPRPVPDVLVVSLLLFAL